MRPFVFFAAVAYRTGNALLFPRRLAWSQLESWIRQYGDPDSIGRGYAGNQIRKARNAYIEVRRVPNGKGWSVTAELIINASQGAARSNTWIVQGLDSKLARKFGDNHRFRVDV
jgi:hypothetical protein